jgi:hypothetical protein
VTTLPTRQLEPDNAPGETRNIVTYAKGLGPDADYDALFRELQRIEADHPDWCLDPIFTGEPAR